MVAVVLAAAILVDSNSSDDEGGGSYAIHPVDADVAGITSAEVVTEEESVACPGSAAS